MIYNVTELSNKHFKKVCGLVYQFSGIHLKEGKEALVKTRLMKRLRALNIHDFDAYLDYVESEAGNNEIDLMIDVMTTNQTSFFREPAHFKFLQKQFLPGLDCQKLRIWSAACSSGQEPYSIAMMLYDHIFDIHSKDVRILATDISKTILTAAYEGIYSKEHLKGMDYTLIGRHFSKFDDKYTLRYKIKDNVKSMVKFAWLNLLDPWPMKGPFNIIFCRNVMIYFDQLTQQELVRRFWNLLAPGGYLFVGHSEGLSAVSHDFQYVQPAIYRK